MYLRTLPALTLAAAITTTACTAPTPVNNLQPTATPATPPRTPLKTALGYIMCTNPAIWYPKSASIMGAHGNVLVRIHVGANGYASDVEVVESSGWEMLDQEAIRAAGSTRCVPFVDPKTGKAVAVTATKPYRFEIEEAAQMVTVGSPAAAQALATPQQ